MALPNEDVRNGRKAKTSANDGGLWEAIHRFWQKSYAGDYLGLIIIATALLFIKMIAEPFHQMFVLNDIRIGHPWAEVERVDVYWLFIYAGVVPLITILLWTLVRQPSNAHKAHVTALGLIISLLLTALITDIIKNFVGRPRPDLISRCDPSPNTPQNELVTIAVCRETDPHKLQDGWRSFPSGHSSFSFAGLGWLALFFASQAHCVKARTSLILILLCLAPLLGAALIAISRLEDYRHDVGDVLVGSIIGCVVTYSNWRRYYPSLTSKWCDEPYDPPGSKSGANGYQKAAQDEEEMVGVEEGDGGGSSRSGSR